MFGVVNSHLMNNRDQKESIRTIYALECGLKQSTCRLISEQKFSEEILTVLSQCIIFGSTSLYRLEGTLTTLKIPVSEPSDLSKLINSSCTSDRLLEAIYKIKAEQIELYQSLFASNSEELETIAYLLELNLSSEMRLLAMIGELIDK